MTLSRRRFLAAAAAVAAAPRLVRADGTSDGFTEIRAGKTVLGLLEDGAGRTEAWLYGAGPQPLVIRGRQGEELKLRFINDLDSEIWLHFFGVRGPSGLMTLNVPPGTDQAVDCVFTPPDAGTFWIGPVADATRARDMGLSAMLVVEEAEALPGIADLALVLDDWKLDDDGATIDDFGDIETMVGEGRLGNWFTVNNRYRPKLPLKPGQFTRLRLLNAANVRTMGVLFKGYDPLIIARDGQPVPTIQLGQKALTLAPGQRADLLVSPENGDIGMALDLFEDIVEIAYMTGAAAGPAPQIADNFALSPNPLSLPAETALTEITVVLEGGIKGGLKSAQYAGETMDLRQLLENGKGWAINGIAGPAIEPLFSVERGKGLLLKVENRTAFAQPLHIHGHVWLRVEGVTFGNPTDTAIVPAGETVHLVFVADNPGIWAIQSLVAERADGGMIGAFKVAEAAAEL